jgi:2-oxo-3-hexenedioate decarboxylase
MALSKQIIEQLAAHVEAAELNVQDITKITDDYPDMTWADAYDIQDEIRRRKEARGQKTVGSESRPHLPRQDEADGR